MPDNAGHDHDQALARLTKLLEGAGQLLGVVVDRVFQRAPDLAKEIKDTVEEEGGNKTVKKRRLVELTADKVLTKVPYSLYLFYCLSPLDRRSVWRFRRISRSGDAK